MATGKVTHASGQEGQKARGHEGEKARRQGGERKRRGRGAGLSLSLFGEMLGTRCADVELAADMCDGYVGTGLPAQRPPDEKLLNTIMIGYSSISLLLSLPHSFPASAAASAAKSLDGRAGAGGRTDAKPVRGY